MSLLLSSLHVKAVWISFSFLPFALQEAVREAVRSRQKELAVANIEGCADGGRSRGSLNRIITGLSQLEFLDPLVFI